MSNQDIIKNQEEYAYDFKDEDVSVFKTTKGLNEDVIRAISKTKGEPDWMLEYRLKAYHKFVEMPLPKFGPDLSDIDFNDFTYYIKPSDKVEKDWDKVPETIKVVINGELPEGVYAKDIILRLLGDLRSDGATYKALEFSGSTVDNMTVASRMTIANMAIEAGAKAALFAPDEKTAEFSGVNYDDVAWLKADADAEYCRVMEYDASTLVPVLACPSQVDNIHPVSELKGTKIDQVFIGSCTNGRLEDIKVAADILRGKKIADYMRLIVTPASRSIYEEASKAGYLKDLALAGAIITQPGCGLCCGRACGIMADGEKILATNNRNFLGRMGSSKVGIYLGSPASAARAALAGEIC